MSADIADKPPQPIDKVLPGPGLLAQTITSKYSDHLPLYRLEDIFARHGVELSRATLCRLDGLLCRAAHAPLYDLMVKRVLLSIVIHTDDTTVPGCWTRRCRRPAPARFWDYIAAIFAIPTWCTTTRRDGRETVQSCS